MKEFCLFFPCLTLVWGSVSAAPEQLKAANPVEVNVPVPKGAEHIVVTNGDADLRKVFTYFPYPPPPQASRALPLSRKGVFQIEVSPEGSVTAITMLRTMGKWLDIPVMKTLVRWKAKPGAFRVVDVTWYYNYQPAGIRGYH